MARGNLFCFFQFIIFSLGNVLIASDVASPNLAPPTGVGMKSCKKWPSFSLVDYNPASEEKYMTSYGLEDLPKRKVTVVALYFADSEDCQEEATLQEKVAREILKDNNIHMNNVVLNYYAPLVCSLEDCTTNWWSRTSEDCFDKLGTCSKSDDKVKAENWQGKLAAVTTMPIFQDTYADDYWEIFGGSHGDLFIYDSSGRLFSIFCSQETSEYFGGCINELHGGLSNETTYEKYRHVLLEAARSNDVLRCEDFDDDYYSYDFDAVDDDLAAYESQDDFSEDDDVQGDDGELGDDDNEAAGDVDDDGTDDYTEYDDDEVDDDGIDEEVDDDYEMDDNEADDDKSVDKDDDSTKSEDQPATNDDSKETENDDGNAHGKDQSTKTDDSKGSEEDDDDGWTDDNLFVVHDDDEYNNDDDDNEAAYRRIWERRHHSSHQNHSIPSWMYFLVVAAALSTAGAVVYYTKSQADQPTSLGGSTPSPVPESSFPFSLFGFFRNSRAEAAGFRQLATEGDMEMAGDMEESGRPQDYGGL